MDLISAAGFLPLALVLGRGAFRGVAALGLVAMALVIGVSLAL